MAPDVGRRARGREPTRPPASSTPARRYRTQSWRWRQEQRTQTRQLRALLAREYLGVGIPRAVATFRHAMSDVIEDKLPFIDRPTLVCRGTRDPIITPGWADEVTRLLPEGRLVSLPGATHAVNHEMPLQTARVIDAFRTRTAA